MLKIVTLNYLDYLGDSVSQSTKKSYLSDIKTFNKYLKHINTDMEDLTVYDANNYNTFLRDIAKLADSTRVRKIQTIKYLYEYAFEVGLVMQDVFQKVKLPKQAKKLPKFLDNNEVERLFAVAADMATRNTEELDVRNELIVKMLVYHGLRVQELVDIKLNNIDSDGFITIHGKGNKERRLYLNSEVKQLISKYLKVRTNQQSEYLLAGDNDRMSKRTAQRVVKQAMKLAGIKGKSTHSLRHTHATLLLENGVDIREIQALLGHENIQTTERYAHVTDKSKVKSTEILESLF